MSSKSDLPGTSARWDHDAHAAARQARVGRAAGDRGHLHHARLDDLHRLRDQPDRAPARAAGDGRRRRHRGLRGPAERGHRSRCGRGPAEVARRREPAEASRRDPRLGARRDGLRACLRHARDPTHIHTIAAPGRRGEGPGKRRAGAGGDHAAGEPATRLTGSESGARGDQAGGGKRVERSGQAARAAREPGNTHESSAGGRCRQASGARDGQLPTATRPFSARPVGFLHRAAFHPVRLHRGDAHQFLDRLGRSGMPAASSVRAGRSVAPWRSREGGRSP